MTQDTRAFVLRIAPSGNDRMSEALQLNEAIIGWADAAGLMNPNLEWEQFREILSEHYYATESNLRRAGAAAGHMWRFLRDMKPGDLLVVPHGRVFYVGKIAGPPRYDSEKVQEDTAYRRPTEWLNNKEPIARRLARAALQSRMKIQGTSADASDLVAEIIECVTIAQGGQTPTFGSDLRHRLAQETLDEIRSGRLDSYGFERLLEQLFLSLGAEEAHIVPRQEDKGADILATFVVGGTIRLLIAVQAKHFQPDPPVGPAVVAQLIRGIEAESADVGIVATSGSFSSEAVEAADAYYEEKGVRIELVDGDQLATMIVEKGLSGA